MMLSKLWITSIKSKKTGLGQVQDRIGVLHSTVCVVAYRA